MEPRLVLGVSDALGIRAAPDVTIDAKPLPVLARLGRFADERRLHAPLEGLDIGKGGPLLFSLSLELGGSEALALAPLGADATVAMRADWPLSPRSRAATYLLSTTYARTVLAQTGKSRASRPQAARRRTARSRAAA